MSRGRSGFAGQDEIFGGKCAGEMQKGEDLVTAIRTHFKSSPITYRMRPSGNQSLPWTCNVVV